MKRFRKALAVVCLIGILFALIPGCVLQKHSETTSVDFTVACDLSWEALFRRTDGWTGADGINTADLLDGRILWIFGDTWIGDIHLGRHAQNAELVNNTLAVHEKPEAGYWMPPDPETVRFFWGQSGQKNLAWIRPDSEDGSGWYWPAGNGLMVKDAWDKSRLIFFMNALERSPDRNEMWAFYRSGNALVIVNNPDEEVSDWCIQTVPVPLSLSGGGKIGWGVSLLTVPEPGEFNESYLYIYGIDESVLGNKKLILARSPAGRVEDVRTWQAYLGNGAWGPFAAECVPISEHLATELSIEPVIIGKALWYIMVYSEDGFGSHILVRMAPKPEGPWSKPFPIYEVKDIRKDKALFTYAAKSHACISRPGELLISYVINALDFEMISQNADLYRPRFVRISFDRIESKIYPFSIKFQD